MDNQILQNNKLVAAKLTDVTISILEKTIEIGLVKTLPDDLNENHKQHFYNVIKNVLFVHHLIEKELGETEPKS